MARPTANGVIGQPSLATAGKGEAVLDSLSRSASEHIALIDGRQRSRRQGWFTNRVSNRIRGRTTAVGRSRRRSGGVG